MGRRHSRDNGGYHGHIGLEMVGTLILKYVGLLCYPSTKSRLFYVEGAVTIFVGFMAM